MTVYDITSGYDFDLTTATSTTSDARVGTIHVATNNAATVGLNANATAGTMVVESANAGVWSMIQSLPGVAADAMDYRFALVANAMSPGDGTYDSGYDDQAAFNTLATYTTDGSVLLNMNTTQQFRFPAMVMSYL